MKREYDFSKGQRGSDVQTIVNDLLKKDISLIQTVTG
jgi:hypothetical protein